MLAQTSSSTVQQAGSQGHKFESRHLSLFNFSRRSPTNQRMWLGRKRNRVIVAEMSVRPAIGDAVQFRRSSETFFGAIGKQ